MESEKYLPGSAASAQHMIADGPYQITAYVPAKSIKFARNPAWSASSDPVRKAYVNNINVSETGNPDTVQTVLQTNSPTSGGMEFNSFPPVSALPGLITEMQHGGTNFNLGPTSGSNPYFVFNTISPNNNKALTKLQVRQAISYALNRDHLIQDAGGPIVNPPLTHILAAGNGGAQNVPAHFNPYPTDIAKAKSLLKAAGYPNGITLNVVYNATSTVEPKMFQTMQADMAPAGIKVKALAVPSADLYTKYAYSLSAAQKGSWDIIMVGWGPDWYGTGALSWFNPLYSCAAKVPNGSNYTQFCSSQLDGMINQALKASTTAQADQIWAQADQYVTNQATTYQITQSYQPNYHSSFVHNAVYVPSIQNFDPTNVWLSS